MMADKLFMLNIELALDGMLELARRRKLPVRSTDTGYMVHVQLKELFGENAPSPFSVRANRGRMLRVLGYSSQNSVALAKQAKLYTEPSVYSTCNWENFVDKSMPDDWSRGQKLGFELRVCPVVRMGFRSDKHKKGAEVDAFLKRCWEIDDPEHPVKRGEVYRDWLAAHLEHQTGARLVNCQLRSFLLQKLLRRRHGSDRKTKLIKRPDATLRGVIEVENEEAFPRLLRNGIGRHRTFGYGMLLLRPVK
ncbi:MAG: type I-E CRISPR-associated protein Cas6/Cse3/CasE [Candidatus Aegiribacteria sp.]|nr:type I-E CRISPR-associated protein Cas6/Cse3/CasE [Candidatus Aegiribacteria sp.]